MIFYLDAVGTSWRHCSRYQRLNMQRMLICNNDWTTEIIRTTFTITIVTGSSHLIVNLHTWVRFVCLLARFIHPHCKLTSFVWIDDNYLDVSFSSTGRMRARNTIIITAISSIVHLFLLVTCITTNQGFSFRRINDSSFYFVPMLSITSINNVP